MVTVSPSSTTLSLKGVTVMVFETWLARMTTDEAKSLVKSSPTVADPERARLTVRSEVVEKERVIVKVTAPAPSA